MVEHRGKKSPREIVEEMGLTVITEDDVLLNACEEAIKNNPKAVKDYLDGNKEALHFLMGQVMKLTRGRAEPRKVAKILKEKLDTMVS